MRGLNAESSEALLNRIESPEVRAACLVLIDGMLRTGVLEARPNVRGSKKSVHFVSGNVAFFGFIANAQWLLWYFRRPGFTQGIYDWNSMRIAFPQIEASARRDPSQAEAILKLSNVADAQAVVQYVEVLLPRLKAIGALTPARHG